MSKEYVTRRPAITESVASESSEIEPVFSLDCKNGYEGSLDGIGGFVTSMKDGESYDLFIGGEWITRVRRSTIKNEIKFRGLTNRMGKIKGPIVYDETKSKEEKD
jgi:hypothetical protein